MGDEKQSIVDKVKEKVLDQKQAAAGLAGEQQQGNMEGVQSSQSAERG